MPIYYACRTDEEVDQGAIVIAESEAEALQEAANALLVTLEDFLAFDHFSLVTVDTGEQHEPYSIEISTLKEYAKANKHHGKVIFPADA